MLPLFLAAAGMGLQALGGVMSISQQRKAYGMQARMARQNAVYQEAQTELDISQFDRQSEQFMSTQRANYAKSGVELSSGSPLEVMADTAGQVELDRSIIRWRGDVEKARWLNEERMAKWNAKTSTRAGYINLVGGLLSSGGSMAMSGKSYFGSGTGGGSITPTTPHIGAGGTTAFGM